MTGMWYKHCPQCGNYIKKSDLQESGMCCTCGWEEYVSLLYCEVVHKYCTYLTTEHQREVDPPGPYTVKKVRQ